MVVKPKALRPSVIARPKAFGSGMVSKFMYLGFDIVVTCIPKIQLIVFLLISNFSEEIIYKLAQITKSKG
jgi:hypothetical protein